MPRKPTAQTRGVVLYLFASTCATSAHGALLDPTWSLRNMQPDRTSGSVGEARTDFTPDPVLPVLDSIGQAGDSPRLNGLPHTASSPRLSGGDGAAESVFPGGVASMTWTQRVLEGVTETRDPAQAQSARPEPRAARALGVPLLGPLLAAAAAAIALIVLRNRTWLARRLRALH